MSFLFPGTQGGCLNNRGKKRIGCEVVEISASSSNHMFTRHHHISTITRLIMHYGLFGPSGGYAFLIRYLLCTPAPAMPDQEP